jgi:16S rRNA (cytosine1402-N4)-methyltransferase
VLKPQPGEIFVDGTLGLGGHTEAILAISEKIAVIGIDRDTEAINLAKED